MDKLENPYAYENFPRARLSFRITRRQLWSAIVTRVETRRQENKGRSVFDLQELGNYSDEQLSGLAPAIVDGCEISVTEGFIYCLPPGRIAAVQLFPQDSPALIAFNLFNGLTTLGEAAKQLSTEMDWDIKHSFAYIRGLFLALVLEGVCLPASHVTP
ncbi:MAG: hypothetical protein HXX08_25100 [Chloroflexi bacterium]|uniref:Uncharacterized protein n=1 Tax=Candidatus Chlorohelix allophototropha TaxID=3003348 RepID=A0A8T7MAD5_9CHLR|nr:hypothetical protein [Chloroflexota bacterium]WJW70338.1 hypothetical protein OZ401_005072 [Chloroflexota bacterium L227-S17]